MSAEIAPHAAPLRLVPPEPTPVEDAWLDDGRLGDLLARAGRGDAAAFAEFYDATCRLVWRLELRRSRASEMAARATKRRFEAAWEQASHHAGSGLSPRAWLLSLPAHAVGRSA